MYPVLNYDLRVPRGTCILYLFVTSLQLRVYILHVLGHFFPTCTTRTRVHVVTIYIILPHFFQRHLSNHFLLLRFVSLLVRLSEQLFRK